MLRFTTTHIRHAGKTFLVGLSILISARVLAGVAAPTAATVNGAKPTAAAISTGTIVTAPASAKDDVGTFNLGTVSQAPPTTFAPVQTYGYCGVPSAAASSAYGSTG